ncbi:MAG: 16S rRNA (uracil(1498)-N(3))-methyltransferase [Geminicoccaceae bacterium]
MSAPRLHLEQRLAEGRTAIVEGDRAHYLRNVLRLRAGGEVRPFNARDGEWSARIVMVARHRVDLQIEHRSRAPADEPGPVLAFAPIRRNRLDWLVEKAVELGAAGLVPVLSSRTVVRPESSGRLSAIVTEAVEQCERLTLPSLNDPIPLDLWLGTREQARALVFADERAQEGSLLAACRSHKSVDILIGPEGGFTAEERERVLQVPGVARVSLGPLILRAETAALAALAGWRLAQER